MDLYRPPEGVWQGGDDKQRVGAVIDPLRSLEPRYWLEEGEGEGVGRGRQAYLGRLYSRSVGT